MQLPGPSPWSPAPTSANGRDRVQRSFQHLAVVAIGGADRQAERSALGVGDDVALGAWTPTVGRVRARRRAPLFAGTVLLSSAARSQQIFPAASRRSSSTRCSRAHTPAACQSRRRRQQVIPDPHPISTGSRSQGEPVTSTNRMPVRAARSGTRGRPPFGRGGAGGNNGEIAAQRSSVTRAWVMHAQPTAQGFVTCS